jgi:hypothetical protein
MPTSDDMARQTSSKPWKSSSSRLTVSTACSSRTPWKIFAAHLGRANKAEHSNEVSGIPPIGALPEVDLVVEGILTMAAATEGMKYAGNDLWRLLGESDGTVLLAAGLLRAKFKYSLLGQTINPHYQDPLLPPPIPMRRYLIDLKARFPRVLNRDVAIEHLSRHLTR